MEEDTGGATAIRPPGALVMLTKQTWSKKGLRALIRKNLFNTAKGA